MVGLPRVRTHLLHLNDLMLVVVTFTSIIVLIKALATFFLMYYVFVEGEEELCS